MALTRSQNMARIRSTNTSPELAIRKALAAKGLRYRLHFKTPGGKADLAIPSRQFALFIDGCFWHGCPEHYVRPRSQGEFWSAKLAENVTRDRRQVKALAAEGWTVVRIWEHQAHESPEKVVQTILSALRASRSSLNNIRVAAVEVVDAATDLERRHLVRLTNAKVSMEERVRTTHKRGVRKGL